MAHSKRHPDIDLSGPTVSSHLAAHPHLSPQRASRQIYPKPFFLKRLWLRFKIKDDLRNRPNPGEGEVERARRAGKWSEPGQQAQEPSELFLKMYADVLLCLERDPMYVRFRPGRRRSEP